MLRSAVTRDDMSPALDVKVILPPEVEDRYC